MYFGFGLALKKRKKFVNTGVSSLSKKVLEKTKGFRIIGVLDMVSPFSSSLTELRAVPLRQGESKSLYPIVPQWGTLDTNFL